MGQMTDATAQLSLSIDPSSAKKAGQSLQPEFQYCVPEKGRPLKSVDASKLSINEYLYEMFLVMGHLMEIDGDWESYFHHFKRVMKFFVCKKYINATYISYDKEAVDSYLKNPANGFNALDSLAIPTHFRSANEHETQNIRSTRTNVRRGNKNKKSRVPYTTARNRPSWAVTSSTILKVYPLLNKIATPLEFERP